MLRGPEVRLSEEFFVLVLGLALIRQSHTKAHSLARRFFTPQVPVGFLGDPLRSPTPELLPQQLYTWNSLCLNFHLTKS